MDHPIVLEDGKIRVAVDAETGYTTSIRNPADESGMNWILGNSNWGHTDGFEIQSVEKKGNSVIVSGINRADFLNLVIEKSVSNGKYIEKYRIENAGDQTAATCYKFTHTYLHVQRGVGRSPHPLPAASAASGALGLAIERKAKSHQRRADKHKQQRIAGHDIPHVLDHIGQGTGIFQNLGDGDSGSSLGNALLS